VNDLDVLGSLGSKHSGQIQFCNPSWELHWDLNSAWYLYWKLDVKELDTAPLIAIVLWDNEKDPGLDILLSGHRFYLRAILYTALFIPLFSTIWALVGHKSHLLDLYIFTMRPGSLSTVARANIKSLGYQAHSIHEFSNPSFLEFLSSKDLAHGKRPSSAESFAQSFAQSLTCMLLTAYHRGSALVTKTRYS